MSFIPDLDTLSLWLTNYGSFALFAALILGIIALPIPEETLMIIAGVLMSKGNLLMPSTIIAALAGSICGITTSYLLGRLASNFFIHKLKWIGITEAHFERAHNWFERFGKWTLFIGYFVPGLRHFTGLVAGMTALQYPHFALYAYTGALFWVSTFLFIGYFFGDYSATLLGW
jgi:membrane protein DedA with SNARE-associated domain